MTAIGSAVEYVVGRPVTLVSGGGGFCLIPGWMGPPLGCWPVGLAMGQGFSSVSADGGPVTRYADSCGSLQVPGKTPNRSGGQGRSLGRWDWPWTTVKRGWIPGMGLLHGPQLGPQITD